MANSCKVISGKERENEISKTSEIYSPGYLEAGDLC